MNWLLRLDPRRHLAAAIGWAVFSVVTLVALMSAYVVADEAQARVRLDSEHLLTQFANEMRDALATHLETRRSILQATAVQALASSDHSHVALRRHLEAVQAQFPEFAWLGVADAQGRVTTAAVGMLEGADVSARPWFETGRTQPFMGIVHREPALDKLLPAAPDGLPQRFIGLAVPLPHAANHPAGVLGAQVSWAWVERLQGALIRSLDADGVRKLSLLLVSADGTVLVGPSTWLGQPLPSAAADVLSQNGSYLVGRPAQHRATEGAMGWTVWVRQDAATALAPARSARHEVFLSVLLAGLAAAAAAAWVTRLLTLRLSDLAVQALGVRDGALQGLTVPAGKDEISRIGATLAELVNHLKQQKKALSMLNAELDARVIERTARIERLSDDARHAAVTRERLRLARDLHDTLAHSLMALLTQIRLIRKLHSRLATDGLEAELMRAEDVAASGLTEARAAITQMRHNGVRETGLGPALHELLHRFRLHTGLDATLQTDDQAAELANERAETVFRIAEEALRNVERHAQAQTVRLCLLNAPAAAGDNVDAAQRLHLEIIDDGVGFDPAVPKPGHYGLRGIEEQVDLIGARLSLFSAPGQGTRILVEFEA